MCAGNNRGFTSDTVQRVAPHKGDPHFLHEVNKVLGEMDGRIIMTGDFNQVMDP